MQTDTAPAPTPPPAPAPTRESDRILRLETYQMKKLAIESLAARLEGLEREKNEWKQAHERCAADFHMHKERAETQRRDLTALTTRLQEREAEVGRLRAALGRISAYDVPDAHEMIRIARAALNPPPKEST